jgi:hypothetical protein
LIREKFPTIGFWYLPSRTLNHQAAEIEKKYRVKFVPRSIFFKKGQEMGRFLGSKTPEELTLYLNEAALTGALSPKPGDVEALSPITA